MLISRRRTATRSGAVTPESIVREGPHAVADEGDPLGLAHRTHVSEAHATEPSRENGLL
jgi:hypothetical protein